MFVYYYIGFIIIVLKTYSNFYLKKMAEEIWRINTQDRKIPYFDLANEKSWSGPFFFIQSADCQFGFISEYLEKNEVVTWEKEIALSEAIVKRVNEMEPPPKFFIICGDLIHAFPNKKYREGQENDFKKVFGKVRSDIPLLCLCGNHDVGNTPTPETIQGYRSSFGDDYYSFYCGGLLFVVINSQYLADATGAPILAEEHSRWFEALLNKAKSEGNRRIIVFQHISWFLQTYDEEKNYFNLQPEIRKLWFPKMKEAGVEAIFCGHYHRNAGGVHEGLQVVVTSAIGGQLGSDQSGARIVTVLPDRVEHKYYPIDELPLKNL